MNVISPKHFRRALGAAACATAAAFVLARNASAQNRPDSLGSMRLNFPSKDGVYMHDTPAKGLFGEDMRFHSSGCMRVQNVRELVNWLLVETPNWSRQEIDAVVKSGERKDAKIARPVPLYWVYVTAWATPDGVTQFREDIYNRDGLGPVAATRRG